MRHIETTSRGVQYFVFEHSKFYQKIQFEFLDAVESLNPQNIAVCVVLHDKFLCNLMTWKISHCTEVLYCLAVLNDYSVIVNIMSTTKHMRNMLLWCPVGYFEVSFVELTARKL